MRGNRQVNALRSVILSARCLCECGDVTSVMGTSYLLLVSKRWLSWMVEV